MDLRRSALVALAFVAFAGCGSDDGEDGSSSFNEDYAAQSKKLEGVGTDLSAAIQAADQKTDAELATQFGELADRTEATRTAIADLEAPDDLTDEVDDLTSALQKGEGDLRDIVTAANGSDAEAARAATEALIRDSSPAIKTSREALDKATK